MASSMDIKRKARYVLAGFKAGEGKWALPQQKAALLVFLADEGLDDQAGDETFVDNLLWLLANPGAMRNWLESEGLIVSEKKTNGLRAALEEAAKTVK